MSDKDKRKETLKKIQKITKIIMVVVTAIFTVDLIVYFLSADQVNKCDSDLLAVNQKINQTGVISTNDDLFQKLGTDGCIDLSKTSHGLITREIRAP